MFIKKILQVLGFMVIAASCSSDPNLEDPLSNKDLPVIYADKSIVNINESEEVTFTVEYLDINVTDGAKIINLITGDTLQGNTVSLNEEMTYEFQAFFKGKLSSNKVEIRGAKPVLSDKYYRQHVLFDFTGTWCSACPGMLQAIKCAVRDYPDRLLPIEVHSGDKLQNEASEAHVKQFGIEAYPSLIIDSSSDYFYKGSATSSNAIISSSKRSMQDNPTVSGVKMDTHIDDNNQITTEVEVSVDQANEYKLCVALLVDGFEYDQSGSMAGKSSQNHVLWGYLQSKASGDPLGQLEKNSKISKTYTYDFSDLAELPYGITKQDCHIIAYILNKQDDGAYQINNATSCSLGASVDYRYEYIIEEK